jgi:ankyrin repeat protein
MEKYITLAENGSLIVDPSLKDLDGNTLLHKLCNNPVENYELIKKMINSVPLDLMNEKNNKGNIFLHHVCANKLKDDILSDIVELSLNKGVDCNIKNNHNNTSLYILLGTSTPSKATYLLLEKVTNINDVHCDGYTLLHRVCYRYQNYKPEWSIILEKLISLGCDTNAKNNKGETPLMLAFDNNNNNECIDLLLKNKADITLCNKAGLDGYYYAEKYGDKKYSKNNIIENELRELKEKYDKLEKKFEQIKMVLQ